ncbi:polypeptide N-acetylgalactosaminyltransferase 12 [Rhincodon typus]|uniref:polypeptide N-acetylgalactosaminyltransferase 12 n=1 Tax=Rhincodon typus TaxID=259920 RepID=UPI00202DB908|nr:polypeptide N-acetylgalactosaminyltransferase 12 [Rhincodon typus]
MWPNHPRHTPVRQLSPLCSKPPVRSVPALSGSLRQSPLWDCFPVLTSSLGLPPHSTLHSTLRSGTHFPHTGFRSGTCFPSTGFRSGTHFPNTGFQSGTPFPNTGFRSGTPVPHTGLCSGTHFPHTGLCSGTPVPHTGLCSGTHFPHTGLCSGTPFPHTGLCSGTHFPHTSLRSGTSFLVGSPPGLASSGLWPAFPPGTNGNDLFLLRKCVSSKCSHCVKCREKKYDYRNLPATSVVIAFYNEAWSTLLRTVHSVLDTSPDILLKELIIVDDYSDREHLKKPLEDYVANLRKVRLIRARKREGLVRARLLGASIATGDVLTFLDCHCECHIGWLEPLLERIKEEETAVVCPVIDVIDWNTFEFLGNSGEPQIGGFDWRLVFTWHVIPEHERKRRRSPIDVIKSPTMAGGLFAVSKKYFEYLGTYDTGMEVWGGENLEFSFRIWQCGGSLEIHPCSHVGHVFPKQAPYSRSKALANSVRAAQVWMDEYKELYFHRNPHARLEPYGDVSERIKLREKLQCKSFKWLLENVYPDIHVPEDRPGFFGMLKNKGMLSYCFDYNPPNEHNVAGEKVILYQCHGMGQNQFFEYSSHNEIRYNTRQPEACASADPGTDYLIMRLCQENNKPVPENQKFIFKEDGSIYHVQTKRCLQAVPNAFSNGHPGPLLRPCTDTDHQKWFFQERK